MDRNIFPRTNDRNTCQLKYIIKNKNVIAGEYSYYHDFEDPLKFEEKNLLYHYPVNNDKLIIGKFCSIANGAKFLFNGGNHKAESFANYPFAIFGELWEHSLSVNSGWDNKGDIKIGNDVWIGYEAVIMAGVEIGNGARIGSRALVTKDVPPYSVVGGIPAKIIKMRFNNEVIEILEKIKWWDWEIETIKKNIPTLTNLNVDELKRFLL